MLQITCKTKYIFYMQYKFPGDFYILNMSSCMTAKLYHEELSSQ